MSLLTTSEVNDLIEQKISATNVEWTNKQHHIQCVECNNSIPLQNIGMFYKCENIETYTLYCVCIKCIPRHLTNMQVKRTHDKIQAIKKENKLQKFSHQNRFTMNQ